MLLVLVFLLGALLVWQAPDFVGRTVLSLWNALKKLGGALGQIGDAGGGLVLIILTLSVLVAGIKGRKQIRQMVAEWWEHLT